VLGSRAIYAERPITEGVGPLLLSQERFDCVRKENAGTGYCNNDNDELKHRTILWQIVGPLICKA